MFQSYEHLKYIRYDAKTNLYTYEYKIVDSDWGAVAVGVEVGVGGGVGVAVAVGVVEEYEKKNLPVAKNLFLCMKYYATKYGYTLSQVISWNKQYNPHYSKYEEEINKYLLFT
jgi:hypothetical protein